MSLQKGIMPDYRPKVVDMEGNTGDWESILAKPTRSTVAHNTEVFNRITNQNARWDSTITAMGGWKKATDQMRTNDGKYIIQPNTNVGTFIDKIAGYTGKSFRPLLIR